METRRDSVFFRRLLQVTTPVGVVIGLHEAWRLAGGLVLLMAVQMLVLGCVAVAVVRRIRAESEKPR